MKTDRRVNRREFGQATATAAVALGQMALSRHAWAQEPATKVKTEKPAATRAFWILTSPRRTVQELLAARELARGMRKLGVAKQPKVAELRSAQPTKQDSVFVIEVVPDRFSHREAYEIATEDTDRPEDGLQVKIFAASPQAALYAVFDFLQNQGVFLAWMEKSTHSSQPLH